MLFVARPRPGSGYPHRHDQNRSLLRPVFATLRLPRLLIRSNQGDCGTSRRTLGGRQRFSLRAGKLFPQKCKQPALNHCDGTSRWTPITQGIALRFSHLHLVCDSRWSSRNSSNFGAINAAFGADELSVDARARAYGPAPYAGRVESLRWSYSTFSSSS